MKKFISISIYFFFWIVLYLFIYSPYIRSINVGVVKILSVIALLSFILFPRSNRYLYIFKIEILIVLMLIVYTSFVLMWGDGSANITPYLHLQFITESIFLPIFLFNIFRKSIDFSNPYIHLIIVGTIAAFVTIFLILNPVTNMYLRQNIILDDIDSDTVQEGLRYLRGFSFAESSTFGYGVVQGIIFVLVLYKAKFKNGLFLLLPAFLISIIFNARIGLVVILAYILLNFKKHVPQILIICFIFYLFIDIVSLNFSFFEDYKQTIDWFNSFFTESFDFLSGKGNDDNTYYVLYSRMFNFPTDFFSILFGEGKIIFGTVGGSDVGYVNQIFNGGIIYLLMLIISLFYYFIKLLKSNSNSFFPYFFLLTMLLVNFKAPSFFTSSSFVRVFMFFYIIFRITAFERDQDNLSVKKL